MTANTRPNAAQIRSARQDNPKMRERDLALSLDISEAELVAAQCGQQLDSPVASRARRINVDIETLLKGLGALGEVMALTRNEFAVHEKIGVYETDKVHVGNGNAIILSENIDLRIFPSVWAHGFAVEKQDTDGTVRRSLQYFDRFGEAVHKVHLRPASDVAAYEALVTRMLSDDQNDALVVDLPGEAAPLGKKVIDVDTLRTRWSQITDVHQFFGMLRDLKLSRHEAVRMIGDEYAWPLAEDTILAMFNHAAQETIPIMCFIGNKGCIQIHSGPVSNIKLMGPWLNVMDPTFHMHLRADKIAETWVVRRPTKDGHVTSVEAYDEERNMILQFFGKRHEGEVEREDWRFLVEHLPRLPQASAA
ncbi:hemin-degrading factor [Limoniibacter endophyticus]|uniref:Hemin-degrading factor n=1 Tax=Limoniibacter endophyticus TaxID=1565040 RepID=A0A8J3GI38_9HYPH|nr:ChuX/HutX family heme-like substrate-binding protein [Limoniibacter endophyticus]GHC75735.1 hemin-degrading factor [Limoniibacter endophyticus]